jgi:Zn-dependent protease with chaperone function
MRQMIQGAVVSFAAAAWFGDISSLAAGFGALVLESRYSREFEREADAWAARLLAANGGSAEVLAQVLLRLEEKARGKGKGGEGADWLASHPDVAERVAALRAAAGR